MKNIILLGSTTENSISTLDSREIPCSLHSLLRSTSKKISNPGALQRTEVWGLALHVQLAGFRVQKVWVEALGLGVVQLWVSGWEFGGGGVGFGVGVLGFVCKGAWKSDGTLIGVTVGYLGYMQLSLEGLTHPLYFQQQQVALLQSGGSHRSVSSRTGAKH